MDSQVDLNGHLAAFLIGDELDSAHDYIVPQDGHRPKRLLRAALDRLPDPEYDAVTLGTLRKAAAAVGRELRLELV